MFIFTVYLDFENLGSELGKKLDLDRSPKKE